VVYVVDRLKQVALASVCGQQPRVDQPTPQLALQVRRDFACNDAALQDRCPPD
jgi:hypothetical protein